MVYLHSKTRQKLYSKPAVLRHLKNESSSHDKSQLKDECSSDDEPQSKNENNNDDKSQLTTVNAENSPAKQEIKGLPSGWTVEIRTRKSGARKGTEYKCFIDPSSGRKFFSRPEVFRYLKSVQADEGSSRGEKRRSTRHSSNNRLVDKLTTEKCNVEPTMEKCNVAPTMKKCILAPSVSQHSKLRARKNRSSRGIEILVENTVDEDLPSGWIKEIRKRLLGDKVVRKDSFYFHPGSDLVFCSKQEVRRYLDSGEISRHAYRRRSWRPGGEELAIGKISPPSSVKSAKTSSYGARKERTCKGVLSLVPEAGVRRTTRSFSKCKAASGGESSPVQLSQLPETANNSREILPCRLLIKMESATEDAIGVTKVVSQNIQNDDGKQNGASMMEMELPSVSSRDIARVNNPDEIAMQGCSDGKPQTSNRKMKNQKLTSVPSRSSKRFAGVDAKVFFHSTPIQHAVRPPSRKSNGTKPIRSLGWSSNSLQEKCRSPDVTHGMLAFQEARHQTVDVNTQPVLATEEQRSSSDRIMQRVLHVVDLKEHPPPRSSKSSENEAQTSNTEQSSEALKDRGRESNTGQIQLPRGHLIQEGQSVAFPESKIEQTAISLPVQKEQPATLGMDTEQSASEFSSPSQSTIVKLPMDPPPPFLGGRSDKLPETTIELSSTGRIATEEPQASTGRDTEQPSSSEFSFPSPLWSDPCLEFAYKTLTGVIPLDDNLAIEDYIQHQLRTSKPGNDFQCLPDVDAPSFFQNDETKLVPPAPKV